MPVELQPPAAEQSAKSYVLNENFAGVIHWIELLRSHRQIARCLSWAVRSVKLARPSRAGFSLRGNDKLSRYYRQVRVGGKKTTAAATAMTLREDGAYPLICSLPLLDNLLIVIH